MNYFYVIISVISYVENRIKSGIQYAGLERDTGFSLAHLRDVFARQTGQTLSAYILDRRVSNAAFEIAHSKESLMAIASRYGFSNPDTFTRAFRRVTGLTPSDFRKLRIPVGRIKLCAGVYGVGFTVNERQAKIGRAHV
jgi:AraC family transcriptional regulator